MYYSSSLKVLCQVIVFIAIVLTSRFYVSGQECGQRKVTHLNLILGGRIAPPGKWPWHVTITHRINNEFKVVCGGSIIDKYTILTAAHCLYTKHGVITTKRVYLHVGRSELFAIDPHTRVYVPDEFLIHPDYRPTSLTDDIALIRLGNEIEMSDYVQPVCVCPAENDTQIVGRIGTVIGFGLNINHEISDHLMEAQVPVVDRWDCLESNRNVFGKHLTRKMLCAGERNAVGPCNGDSGGGYVFPMGERWCVRGIVSFTQALNHTNTCDPKEYIIYTDVAKYIDWLRDNTNATYYPNVRQFPIKTAWCKDGELCGMKVLRLPGRAVTWWKGHLRCVYYTVLASNVEVVVDSCTVKLVSTIIPALRLVKENTTLVADFGATLLSYIPFHFKRA